MSIYLILSLLANLVLLAATGYLAWKYFQVKVLVAGIKEALENAGQRMEANAATLFERLRSEVKSWTQENL